ncbi:baseplate multidomain protein megatron [Aliiruegeria sabulilitoris]|uniref:baseplate multidomain protein megatron n=1 Tax=Aliiruegeria sabulilitoris TaxID=1510458 RepID=UPI00082A7D1A|nr:glycoside hydrolase/phage tail family protein [Aliiruegeria sabulilitoris]NDR56057.1 host specificity protein [Pseudoruegeria sp. M32A2M]
MATLILSAAGAAIGGAFGGTAFGLSTAVLGRAIGATLGRVVDQTLLGGGSQVIETGKIERFQLTGASEGTAVGAHYGRVRAGGQVIWSTKFKEKVKKEEVGGKGGGGTTTKAYSYSISIAVALCEGQIRGVERIWADGMEISRENVTMRVYSGSEDQLPDPKIEAIEGAANAPAYRGLAYVVFEDLELGDYGNRVPQFSFEIIRGADPERVPANEKSLAETIRAVALIPGTGEYSLSTNRVNYTDNMWWSASSNENTNSGKTDFDTSMDHLAIELPHCGSVSLVVSWFGNDLRCGECSIAPKVEQTEFDGDQQPWRVSGLARVNAKEVARIDDRPVYGGTPADASVLEAIYKLRADGKSVVFYPFILMEQLDGNGLPDPWSESTSQPALPWRGRITTEISPGRDGSSDKGTAARTEVEAFFGQAQTSDFTSAGDTITYLGPEEWSFRRFILHYAHLCAMAGGVDAFCIGSEMRGLTQIRSDGNTFPAVEELVKLAQDVRAILGTDTKIGYAADWSEYFGYHPQDGSGDVLFHLDPLWASDEIDFVGIDNYMPLSDWRDSHDHADAPWRSIYNLDYLKSNIEGGEGFEWYYADEAGRYAQQRLPIEDGAHGEPWVFRYKDIRAWWSQEHYDRIAGVRQAAPTTWLPESKPIWFTEIGCAAVDKGTNQPNKFVDPKSSESSVPWFSSGLRDDLIQMQYIRATCQYWSEPANNPTSAVYGNAMIDLSHVYVWAWDARPYPYFPASSDIWSDGENYSLGHWLNGRASSESLAAVVSDICSKAGVTDVDVSELYGLVRGYGIDETSGARSALQPLSLAHSFDAAEREGRLSFHTRTGIANASYDEGTFVKGEETVLSLQRGASADAVGTIRVNYVQADGSFETRTTEASIPGEEDATASSSDLAMCLTSTEGLRIAERWLAEARIAMDSVSFTLPPSAANVHVGDVVDLTYGGCRGNFRIDRVEIGEARKVEAVRVEPDLFRPPKDIEDVVSLPKPLVAMPVFSRFLDLPLITGDEDPVAPYVAVSAKPWPGSVAVYTSSEDDGYSLNKVVQDQSVFGLTQTPLLAASCGLLDRGAQLQIRVPNGVLSSATRTALLNGANSLAIGNASSGDWEILQFEEAQLVALDTYVLSGLLRGQLGTDAIIPSVWPEGSLVVLLDGGPSQIELASSVRGLERHYRVGPADRGYSDNSYEHFVHTATGVGLRPYLPVHLKSSRDTEGNELISWIRRSRIDGDSWEGLEIPLGEENERYLVQVLEGDGTVIREAETNQPNWSYSAEMKATDAVYEIAAVQVAQMSERYGVGPFQRIEIHE